MRRIAAVVALVVCGAAAASAGAGGAGTFGLRVVDRDPLTVQGYGFKARERVRVTVSTPDSPKLGLSASPSRVMRASVKGSFRVVFSEIVAHRCSWVHVVAIGGGDSRAVLKVPPRSPSPSVSSRFSNI